MLKHLLVLVALLIGIQADENSTENNDTSTFFMAGLADTSYLPIASGQPLVISMKSHNNYIAAQQVYGINRLEEEGHMITEKGRVPADYQVTLGIGAHKLHTEELTWNEARKACIMEGAHLAIINSKKEEEILLQLMKSNPEVRRQPWLGFHDLYQEGEFVTIFDQPLEDTGFVEWTKAFPNEPDNLGGNQNCGSLFKTGGLDDVVCDGNAPFFCEISLNL